MRVDLAHLALLTQQGDHAARDHLVRIGYRWVHGFFKHDDPKVPTGMAQDDLVQEGILAFMRAAQTWNGSGSFDNFACIVVRNRWIDLISQASADKRRGNENTRSLDAPFIGSGDDYNVSDIPDPSPYSRDPLMVLIEAWERASDVLLCRSLLGHLPDTQQRALLRVYGLEESYVEAADALGWTAKRVDNAVSRGKAKMRQIAAQHRAPTRQEEVNRPVCSACRSPNSQAPSTR